jgi:hypothetical protein
MIIITAIRFWRDVIAETARLRREVMKRYPSVGFES